VNAKVALVTGSGRPRVGNVVALALARAGYALAVHYHRSAGAAAEAVERLRSLGAEAMPVEADLTDETAIRQMVQQVLDRFGRVDALVSAAAVWQREPLETVTAADVRRHFEVNALGSFLCAQHVGLAMVRQPEGGAIVLLGDWAVARPYVDYAAYFPSKGAVVAMTRSLAVELASRNPAVRVNCILPGPVMLPDDLPAADRAAAIRATLVRRAGRPEHVAHAALFLIENDFVTGVCLPIDGGRTICPAD
jgi:pteridine reductase